MSRLALVERTKLNLSEVTVVMAGTSSLELDILRQVLAGFGARQIRRAEDAKQLSDQLKGVDYDLLLIDVMIGLESALDVVRTVRRRQDDRRFTPVILTTANATASMVSQARNSGANFVVSKPFAPVVLFERLVWIVKDARSFVEADNYAGPDRRVRPIGPPAGMDGRRQGDLSVEVGEASAPNMSQVDIDAMMFPVRKSA